MSYGFVTILELKHNPMQLRNNTAMVYELYPLHLYQVITLYTYVNTIFW